jgi:DNA-binding winged helix-turn-helix (wHTH) protein
MMIWDTLGTSKQFTRSRKSWGDDPSSTVESVGNGIVCSIWKPEPSLLILVIRLWPLTGPSGREPSIVSEGNGQNVSNGTGAVWRRLFPISEVSYMAAMIEEGEGADGRESAEVRMKLVLLGNCAQQRSDQLEFHRLSIDPVTREVEVDGHGVELTRREFEPLYLLMRHQRQIFTRSQLLDCVWGWDFCIDESTVTVHISRLRHKLSRGENDLDFIQTVWGVGYKFEPPNGRVQL